MKMKEADLDEPVEPPELRLPRGTMRESGRFAFMIILGMVIGLNVEVVQEIWKAKVVHYLY